MKNKGLACCFPAGGKVGYCGVPCQKAGVSDGNSNHATSRLSREHLTQQQAVPVSWLGSPGDPETRIQAQVVSLGGDPRTYK